MDGVDFFRYFVWSVELAVTTFLILVGLSMLFRFVFEFLLRLNNSSYQTYRPLHFLFRDVRLVAPISMAVWLLVFGVRTFSMVIQAH